MPRNSLTGPDFGRRLAAAREARGLSQTELAKRLDDGATPATISRWESGQFGPNRARLDKLVRILGVSIASLLDERTEATMLSDAARVEAEYAALRADYERLQRDYDRLRSVLSSALDASTAPKRQP